MFFEKMQTRKNDGFTLVELIVVIAILAILADIGVPAYSGYVEKANISIQLTHQDPANLYFSITDNGQGVPTEALAHIFERFYRTDTSRNSMTGGSGIGLSIVKKIVEEHGGKIWATSKEGIGTILYFVIRKYQEVPVNE